MKSFDIVIWRTVCLGRDHILGFLQLIVLRVEPVQKYRRLLCREPRGVIMPSSEAGHCSSDSGSSLSDLAWRMVCGEKKEEPVCKNGSCTRYVQGLWNFKNCHSKDNTILSRLPNRSIVDYYLGQHRLNFKKWSLTIGAVIRINTWNLVASKCAGWVFFTYGSHVKIINLKNEILNNKSTSIKLYWANETTDIIEMKPGRYSQVKLTEHAAKERTN